MLHYTDRVGVVLNIPQDKASENSGYEELNRSLLATSLLTDPLKNRCKFLLPNPEPEDVRPFLRLRSNGGHLLEGVQIHYTRQVLLNPDFAEFLNLELPPLDTHLHHKDPSSKRKLSESDAHSSNWQAPKSKRVARKSSSWPQKSTTQHKSKSPKIRGDETPPSIEVANQVNLFLLKEARRELGAAWLKISELYIKIGELRGEKRILRRLLRRKTVAGRRLDSSSSSSDSSSEDSDDPDSNRRTAGKPPLGDEKEDSSSEPSSGRKVTLVDDPKEQESPKRDW